MSLYWGERQTFFDELSKNLASLRGRGVASQKVLPVPYSLQQILPNVRLRFSKDGRDHVERTTVKLIAMLKL